MSFLTAFRTIRANARRIIVAAALIPMLAACAGQQTLDGESVVNRETILISSGVRDLLLASDGPVTLETDPRIYCSTMTPTGSHIPVTYCRTRVEFDQQLAAGQAVLRREITGDVLQ